MIMEELRQLLSQGVGELIGTEKRWQPDGPAPEPNHTQILKPSAATQGVTGAPSTGAAVIDGILQERKVRV